MGRAAADTLLATIRGLPAEKEQLLPTSLIYRESL
jgi:DNA-binding LacI/PurR family transcriptional regulator